MRRATIFAILVTGFTAMSTQIVFIRELLSVFYGNELSIGLSLASWLLGGALGSCVFGALSDRIGPKAGAFSLCQLALAAGLIPNIILIRCAKNILNITVGEIVPLFPMLLSSLAILAPLGALLGFMFALACRIYADGAAESASHIGEVYALESAGAIAGGLVTSFIFIRMMSPVNAAAILIAANIFAAILLQLFSEKGRLGSIMLAASSAMLITVIAMWPLGSWRRIERDSLRKQWKGYDILASKNSIYGNITVARTGDETAFFDNGLLVCAVPDPQGAEESAHFALLQHQDPSDVLIIGGGFGGLVEEALKHPVTRVDYVEIDPLIIRMAEEYLPERYSAPLRDRRVSIKNIDGVRFVKTTRDKYDVVIMRLGNPATAQVNRLYTTEFFTAVRRMLKDGGVLSFSVNSSESYVNADLGMLLKCLYFTVKDVFADAIVMPGDTAYYLATDRKDLLTYDYRTMMKRAGVRALDVKYVREYYLFSRLSDQRIKYMQGVLKSEGAAEKNRSFFPVAYYYDILYWTGHFRDTVFRPLLKYMTRGRIAMAFAVIVGAILIFGPAGMKRPGFYKRRVLCAVTAMGLSVMALQVVVIFAFQTIYGYLFYKLGMILTSFMIGLAAGGWYAAGRMARFRSDRGAFLSAQAGIAVYLLALPVLFTWLLNARPGVVSLIGSNVVFPALPVIAGFIGGFQFPVANKICLAGSEGVGRVAGLTYGLDLLGAFLGAVLTAVFLIPLIGVAWTCWAIASLDLAILVVLALSLASRPARCG